MVRLAVMDRTRIYTWILAHVGEEHRYLVQDTTEVGDIERLFENLRGSAESDPEQLVECSIAYSYSREDKAKVDGEPPPPRNRPSD